MKYNLLFLICITLNGCHKKMNTQNSDKKIIIAHRGASGYLPEHTIEAKVMAYAMDADFIEQDIVLSKDNIPIVIHDIYLDDVTDVSEKFPKRHREDNRFYVIDFTFKELKTLRVSERFIPETGEQVYKKRFPKEKGNFKLHCLQEEIELIQGLNLSTGKNIGIYPEIKAPKFHKEEGKKISEIVLNILSTYGYNSKIDNCIVQCFDSDELKRIRVDLKSDLFLVQLIEYPEETLKLKYFATYADGIGPWYKQILKEKMNNKWTFTSLVSEAHALGLKVHPYTFRADALGEFPSFEKMLEILVIDANVDGVFTDFPDKVHNFFTEN